MVESWYLGRSNLRDFQQTLYGDILVFWHGQFFEISKKHYMVESWYFGTIESLRSPRNINCEILVFWDDQIFEISTKHYGTPSKYRLPPLHPTTLLGDTSELPVFLSEHPIEI